ncbi:putative secondary metabolism biosynthetic enzyme [Lepraria neglecta]|uniref:Secondary metabolism biosynthetic enzyme n=1 Tax=Lepraria neglecta TaxID=209136 RepID=A0AAE0DP35_9LECA|nr:putative secondary metabolism biosynthetic enzyme [Lepraria neglecta]
MQLFITLPYPASDLSGKTIIVTGSNVGLGLEAARHFTRLNADKVILGVRNLEKGETAKKSIEETTNRLGVVEVWQLDLASYESTKQFVKRAEGLRRLDAVVENAGIATMQYQVAEDNESTITTNVVSTYLLALMILPKLRETATKFNTTPHLTIVCSEVHAFTSFPEKNSPNIFKTLSDKETANMADRYRVSKLLEVFYTRELAARVKRSGKPEVIINYLNPGLCHSGLAREAGWRLAIIKFLFARTTEHGSRTLVHAAEAGPESHGQYLSSCSVSDPSPLVRSEEGAKAQKQVWDELSQKLENVQPGIMTNV